MCHLIDLLAFPRAPPFDAAIPGRTQARGGVLVACRAVQATPALGARLDARGPKGDPALHVSPELCADTAYIL
jgi:hypothetical protein